MERVAEFPDTGGDLEVVGKYIANQHEHHKKMDCAVELALLLKKHGFEVQK